MKPSNWLFNTARYAYASKSDYARVVIAPKTTREGPDAMALLTDDVAGAVLYVFCEPGTAVLRRAEEVGIAAVYCVLQAKDVARLIDAGHPLQLTVVDGVCDLKPQCFDFVRREVMSQWLEQPIVTRPRDSLPTHWLGIVSDHAKARKTNYAVAVCDGKVVSEGIDLREALKADVSGSTLYSFRELTPAELGRAEDAGIKQVYFAISRRDAEGIQLWPACLIQKGVQRVREQTITDVVEKWND